MTLFFLLYIEENMLMKPRVYGMGQLKCYRCLVLLWIM